LGEIFEEKVALKKLNKIVLGMEVFHPNFGKMPLKGFFKPSLTRTIFLPFIYCKKNRFFTW